MVHEESKRVLDRMMLEEGFKRGARSVYRPVVDDKNVAKNVGQHLRFMGDNKEYIVGKHGNLINASGERRTKKEIKAAKRERINARKRSQRKSV